MNNNANWVAMSASDSFRMNMALWVPYDLRVLVFGWICLVDLPEGFPSREDAYLLD